VYCPRQYLILFSWKWYRPSLQGIRRHESEMRRLRGLQGGSEIADGATLLPVLSLYSRLQLKSSCAFREGAGTVVVRSTGARITIPCDEKLSPKRYAQVGATPTQAGGLAEDTPRTFFQSSSPHPTVLPSTKDRDGCHPRVAIPFAVLLWSVSALVYAALIPAGREPPTNTSCKGPSRATTISNFCARCRSNNRIRNSSCRPRHDGVLWVA